MSRPPKAPQDRATCALTLRMTLRDARALRAWAKARGKALAPLLVQAGLREASDYERAEKALDAGDFTRWTVGGVRQQGQD